MIPCFSNLRRRENAVALYKWYCVCLKWLYNKDMLKITKANCESSFNDRKYDLITVFIFRRWNDSWGPIKNDWNVLWRCYIRIKISFRSMLYRNDTVWNISVHNNVNVTIYAFIPVIIFESYSSLNFKKMHHKIFTLSTYLPYWYIESIKDDARLLSSSKTLMHFLWFAVCNNKIRYNHLITFKHRHL